jgi:hypothetical protein
MSRIIFRKLTVADLVWKPMAIYGAQLFISAKTEIRYCIP